MKPISNLLIFGFAVVLLTGSTTFLSPLTRNYKKETEEIRNTEKVTRTIYSIKEIGGVIEKYKPVGVIRWDNNNLNNWIEKKDIAIIVHFPMMDYLKKWQ